MRRILTLLESSQRNCTCSLCPYNTLSYRERCISLSVGLIVAKATRTEPLVNHQPVPILSLVTPMSAFLLSLTRYELRNLDNILHLPRARSRKTPTPLSSAIHLSTLHSCQLCAAIHHVVNVSCSCVSTSQPNKQHSTQFFNRTRTFFTPTGIQTYEAMFLIVHSIHVPHTSYIFLYQLHASLYHILVHKFCYLSYPCAKHLRTLFDHTLPMLHSSTHDTSFNNGP